MTDHVVTGLFPSGETVPIALTRQSSLARAIQRGRESRGMERGTTQVSINNNETELPRSRYAYKGPKTNNAKVDLYFSGPTDNTVVGSKEDIEYDLRLEPTRNVRTPYIQGNESHIQLIEYSSKWRKLRATFSNTGAQVVYELVPMQVFAQLQLAQTMGQSVGARFWDLLRGFYRSGTPIGGPYDSNHSQFYRKETKYSYSYIQPNRSLGARSKQLTDDEGNPISGSAYKQDYYDPFIKNKEGETVGGMTKKTAYEIRKLEAERARKAVRSDQVIMDPYTMMDAAKKAMRRQGGPSGE